MNLQLYRFLNLIGLLFVLIMNTLANALPLNGKNTGELSAQYPNSFVPAGFTFSIWGIIYLFLIAFIIFQFSRKASEQIKKIGLLFFISCLANGGWILAWHYEYVAFSLIFMLVILASLLLIYVRLNIACERVGPARKWLIHIPFSIYVGWITVATIANTTALLVHWGWQGGGLPESSWAGIMVLVAGLIGSIVVGKRRDVFYGLVLLWAFWGIWWGQQPLASFLRISLIIAGTLVLSSGIRTLVAKT